LLPVRRASVYTPGTRAIRADAFDYRAIHVECRLCGERSVINLPHNLQAIGGPQRRRRRAASTRPVMQ